MAYELGIPLRSVRTGGHLSCSEDQLGASACENGQVEDERVRERGLSTRARRALGAARGVVSVVRTCGSRIAFRCSAAYPRRRSAPPAVFNTGQQQRLSVMSLGKLDALRANLEAEEAGLMEKLRELWLHLAAGSHLQPAFVDQNRLTHVTELLLAGDTDAVERDPDNDEVSGAAIIQLTSQRLEAALLEVHAHMQAVCEERRRRKGLQPRVSPMKDAAGQTVPRRGLSQSAGSSVASTAFSSRAKRALSISAGSTGRDGTSANVMTAPSSPALCGSRCRGRAAEETPKRKLSLPSVSLEFLHVEAAHSSERVGSPRPRPKLVTQLRARLAQRAAGASPEVPCSWPANDSNEAQGMSILQLGYTQLPTND